MQRSGRAAEAAEKVAAAMHRMGWQRLHKIVTRLGEIPRSGRRVRAADRHDRKDRFERRPLAGAGLELGQLSDLLVRLREVLEEHPNGAGPGASQRS